MPASLPKHPGQLLAHLAKNAFFAAIVTSRFITSSDGRALISHGLVSELWDWIFFLGMI
jgi:hypothetical protein